MSCLIFMPLLCNPNGLLNMPTQKSYIFSLDFQHEDHVYCNSSGKENENTLK